MHGDLPSPHRRKRFFKYYGRIFEMLASLHLYNGSTISLVTYLYTSIHFVANRLETTEKNKFILEPPPPTATIPFLCEHSFSPDLFGRSQVEMDVAVKITLIWDHRTAVQESYSLIRNNKS